MNVKIPRDEQRLLMGGDIGGFSIKAYSNVSSGSVYSIASQLEYQLREEITDQATYDLEILNTPRGAVGRYVVGRDALRFDNSKRFTRDMVRIDDTLYDVFMCAALRTAFPDVYRMPDDLKSNRNQVRHQWRRPVKVVILVAPAFYQLAESIIATLKGQFDDAENRKNRGYFDFIDRKSGNLYTFHIDRVVVLYEGWGIYSSRLYEAKKDGTVGVLANAMKWKRAQISIIDIGGRTSDAGTWLDGRPIERRTDSATNGIITTSERIINELMRHYPKSFGRKPDPLYIIRKIEEAQRSRSKKITLNVKDGVPIDATEIVDRNMNQLASDVFELYQNTLESGEGTEGLIYGGGGSVLLKPYLNNFIHFKKQYLVSKNMRDMYMANAVYSYFHIAYQEQRGK